MLRWMGHSGVAVLNGGWQAWLAAGQPVTTAVRAPMPARFTGIARSSTVDAKYVLEHLQSPDMVLIDARASDRYHGQNETIDPIGGHIPGARNRFFKDNLTPQGFFKSPEQLREDFKPFVGNGTPEKIVSQCGSGVTACHNLLAMEIAGLKGGRLYPGSWSEWIADPSRPRAT
jgi:thiosulfate/3-mercaptopyruvate sulfurtransferase